MKNSLENFSLFLPYIKGKNFQTFFFSLFQSCSMANPYLRHTLLLYKGNFIILFIQGCLKKMKNFLLDLYLHKWYSFKHKKSSKNQWSPNASQNSSPQFKQNSHQIQSSRNLICWKKISHEVIGYHYHMDIRLDPICICSIYATDWLWQYY